ncbi:MAG TPA: hypothetical protein VNR89_11885 [Roseomonas sp.]|nr:hypothetical protein [Roseomonas sp.]
MNQIPEFLTFPESDDKKALRRTDLADLRLCIRHPEGIEDGRYLSKMARIRLIAHGMLSRRIAPDGWVRTYATGYGHQVARANASCRDGSEAYALTPADYRQRAAAAAVGRSSGPVTGEQVLERLREIARRPGGWHDRILHARRRRAGRAP